MKRSKGGGGHPHFHSLSMKGYHDDRQERAALCSAHQCSLLKNAFIDDLIPFGYFIYGQILICKCKLMRLSGVFQQAGFMGDVAV